MKQLKKTLLTLAALLALTAQAWATDPKVYDSGDVELFSLQVGDILMPGVTLKHSDVNNYAYANLISNRYSIDGEISPLGGNSISSNPFSIGENGLLTAKLAGNGPYNCMPITEDGKAGNAWVVTDIAAPEPDYKIILIGGTTYPAASGPEVAWDKAKNTGKFTMPGGNVTLEPEYYPQAVLTAAPTAINDVPATTDGAIVKAGTVANIGSTETAQGTVMYYVSTTALDDAALLALAADKWKADVPTAAHLAEGKAYVYYYVRGNDSDTDEENFSDGDILAANALTVTIAAEPTYAVEFAEGTAEPTLWKAEPATGVTKGQTVTVTYTGSKKVIGVKAEKKEKAPALKTLANATAEDLGKIAGADGNIYDTKAAAEAAGTTAVAMIAYVGSDTGNDTYTHGLAIALSEEDEMNWSNAKSTCEGKSAVSGAAWLLPSRNQWKAMFKANGGNEGSYSGLNTAIGTAGGTALQVNERYWSSSELDADFAWVLVLGENSAGWDGAPEDLGHHVRACLAF